MEERDPLISSLWREAEQPEPPGDLDNRILGAARQAVTRPKPEHRGWWRLAVPFSATAVLVLAVTLLLRVERESPDMLSDAAPPVIQSLQKPEMAEAERQVSGQPAELGGAATRPQPDQNRVEAPASEAGTRPDSPSPAARPASKPVPVPASPALEADQAGGQADTLIAPPSAAAPMRREAVPRFNGMELGKAKSEGAAGFDPEHAVERIRRLLGEGRREEALEALAELRRQHPDFELPPDLRVLP